MDDEIKEPEGAKVAEQGMLEDWLEELRHRFDRDYRFSRIDRKTRELIALAASLAAHSEGCLENHLRKALENGATKEEVSEAICITMGVAAASVVDQTDKIAEKLKVRHFE